MSKCKHEMIWVGSSPKLCCAKCNESYDAIQIGKIAQLEAELSECRAENERLREAIRAYDCAHSELAKACDGGRLTNPHRIPRYHPDMDLVARAMEAGRAALQGEQG